MEDFGQTAIYMLAVWQLIGLLSHTFRTKGSAATSRLDRSKCLVDSFA